MPLAATKKKKDVAAKKPTKTVAAGHTVTVHKQSDINKQVSSDTEVLQGKRISFPNGYIVQGVNDSIKLSHNYNSAGIEVFVQVPVDVEGATDKAILAALARADGLCAEHVTRHMPSMRDMLLNIDLGG